MNFVSLFAGVGGFDLAFEGAGMTCVGQVEIDDKASEVLAEHWPDIPRWADIHDVKGDDFGSTVDVLVGGFPCQDYSSAGLRSGLAGDRGAVWWEFHRLIAEIRPTWVVGENVPGLLSSNGGRDFGTIVGSLVELGYSVCWRVCDAQYFGVPQRRRRLFLLAGRNDRTSPPTWFLDFAQIGGGTSSSLNSTVELARHAGGTCAGTIDDDGYCEQCGGYDNHFGCCIPPEYFVIEPLSGQGADLKARRVGIAPTVTANQSQRTGGDRGLFIVDGESGMVRRLTPLECERLQGFPDNWTASQSDTQRYRQIGNAVAVPVARWIAEKIVTR